MPYKFVVLPCSKCGRDRRVPLANTKKAAFTNLCHSCGIMGENNPAWKGGKYTHLASGYIRIHVNKDHQFISMASFKHGSYTILEHRLVMAEYLQRSLTSAEIVHHINGIKNDNRIENLTITTKKHHRVSYQDAYKDGFKAGVEYKYNTLEKEIRLLRWQIKELQRLIQLKMEV